MPYIITTWHEEQTDDHYGPTSEPFAVATLDEAHDYLGNMTDDDALWNVWRRDIGELGGTVGPLPDGTVIQVEQVEWDTIGEAFKDTATVVTPAEAIDAFNASQA